jgi:hypothetical protein
VITDTWYDPCPACGREVTGVDAEPEYVTDNPTAVIPIRNPACPYDGDPESADCICPAIINPAPDPMLDTWVPVGATFIMHPCGDVIRSGFAGGNLTGLMAGWKIYQRTRPETGSLGELLSDWAAADPP